MNKRQMWRLYQTATTLSQRPSDIVCIEDRWAALQFDNAVITIGLVVENALQEQVNMGGEEKPDMQPKYEIEELLADDFRFPAAPTEQEKQKDAIQALIAWSKLSENVRVIDTP